MLNLCLAGDLVVDVRNRELDILMELLSRLRILEPRLRTAAQRLAELDVLLAFTAAALKYQWVTWFKWEHHRSVWGGLRFFLFFFLRDFYGNCILFDFLSFCFLVCFCIQFRISCWNTATHKCNQEGSAQLKVESMKSVALAKGCNNLQWLTVQVVV